MHESNHKKCFNKKSLSAIWNYIDDGQFFENSIYPDRRSRCKLLNFYRSFLYPYILQLKAKESDNYSQVPIRSEIQKFSDSAISLHDSNNEDPFSKLAAPIICNSPSTDNESIILLSPIHQTIELPSFLTNFETFQQKLLNYSKTDA